MKAYSMLVLSVTVCGHHNILTSSIGNAVMMMIMMSMMMIMSYAVDDGDIDDDERTKVCFINNLSHYLQYITREYRRRLFW